jgi:transposase-like protein
MNNNILYKNFTKMKNIKNLINNESFSKKTLHRVSLKKTEKGAMKALCTMDAFEEAYPNKEFVFERIFEARRLKSNDKCSCGSPISKYYERIPNTYQYRCKSCRKKVAPLSGTPLQETKIDLSLVMKVIFRAIQSKHGISSAEIARDYNIKYETALKLMHKIMDWMGLVVKDYKFDNTTVQGDETYVRVPTGLPKGFKYSRGLGSERIKPVLTLVEKGGNAKALVVDEVEKYTLRNFYKDNVSLSSVIYTDGSKAYNFLAKSGYNHKECNHVKKEWSTDDGVNVNSAECLHSLLKNQIGAVNKGCSAQHLQKYANQVCFVFSNRFRDPYSAIESLFKALPAFPKLKK